MTCAIGAEVSNVNLGTASRDPALIAEIRSLVLKYKVLFFRDQDITRAEHVAFARHFGELEDHPVAGSDPDHPGLVRIYKSPDAPSDRYENAWHTDATWREKPPFGCVLRCVECPPVGGDTMWANMALAYERLPEAIKTQISGLRARHSIEATFGASMPIEKRLALKAQFPDAEHPVVRTHPETGEKILFVNGFTTHFTNFHTAARVRYGQDYSPGAAQLLQYLISQAQIPGISGALALEAEQRRVLGQSLDATLRGHGLPAVPPEDGTRRHQGRPAVLSAFGISQFIQRKDTTMHFLDGALFPENQQKLVITASPYGPEWVPSDFPEDIAVTMDEQVQKAVDCYNAGATVLHVHVREADGKGSKRLSKFNELLARLRVAVPDMVLQVGGSISFAPESEGDKAKWLSDDTRHMLAELMPQPDQVTVTVNTSQMNIVEQMEPADIAGTSLAILRPIRRGAK